MKLHEIENLPAAELKARREELTAAAAADENKAELPARYVQARTDATLRDEKLSEQGATISALQNALAALEQRATDAEARTGELVEAARISDATHAAQLANQASALASMEAAANDLAGKLSDETARSTRLKAEAVRNNAALSGAAKLLNDALSAQRIDDAGN